MGGEPFGGAFVGRRILLTGESGFAGSWAARWLSLLGADVLGLSRGASTPPVPRPERLSRQIGDIEDADRVAAVVHDYAPHLVLHMAGQTLVSRGYAAPAQTFRSNLLGTLDVLDAALHCPHTQGTVLLGTPAADGMLGPYAASKQALTALAMGYTHPLTQHGVRDRPLRIAVVHPGVLVGGDWAEGRLVPDLVRAVSSGQPVRLRQPESVRPWQHVLDGLSGVLAVGARLLTSAPAELIYTIGWPEPQPAVTARQLTAALLAGLEVPNWPVQPEGDGADDRLQLDCATAARDLGWSPTWDFTGYTSACAAWYRTALDDPGSLAALTDAQIGDFVRDARMRPTAWATGAAGAAG